jgi:hypothetical protein
MTGPFTRPLADQLPSNSVSCDWQTDAAAVAIAVAVASRVPCLMSRAFRPPLPGGA